LNIEQYLEFIQKNRGFMENVTAWKVVPERPPVYAGFPPDGDPRLAGVLEKRGISRLYSHQAEAWSRVRAGENVVVVTPTASGKTLCYNLPVIDRILSRPQARALYLFPTKALSQDQVAELHEIVEMLGVDIKTNTYDGDTPGEARRVIRSAGHIVVTNPDMLHTAILPHHTKWIRLFENLEFVVIDEIHHYRGVFGSHVTNVIRRLKRICRFYGSNPRFICCSATIKNPLELVRQVIEEDVSLIDNNGAPTGEKHVVFINPPVVNRLLGIRKSALLHAREIASALVRNGIQTIVFARTRLSCEVLTTYLKEALRQVPGADPDRIRGYRGGYLPRQRREIEKGLRSGQVTGVVSTNALELGIDIGRLDACVICGYPGTISSTWQQAGRAGRRRGVSGVFLVATPTALDQFIITHPEYFFGENIESGFVNPDNLYILVDHVKCASFEIPFEEGEAFGSARVAEILGFLEGEKILRLSGGRWHWAADSYPAEDISLRSAGAENFVVIDTSDGARVIGEVDRFSAPMLIHEEAIYLHESSQYQVERLDYQNKKAYVRPVDVDYYTDANLAVNVKVIAVDREVPVEPAHHKAVGEVQINALVTMFKKIKFHTHENVGSGPVDLPEQEMHTSAYWMSLDEERFGSLEKSQVESGIMGISNLLGSIAPLYLMCDPRDIHSVVQVRSPHTLLPTIFIYDSYPGGVGLSEKLFDVHGDLLVAAQAQARACSCAYGCPSCVGPEENVGLNRKKSTLEILEMLTCRESRK
jgi:DEAD/DEAH box helicase domain-containing protein